MALNQIEWVGSLLTPEVNNGLLILITSITEAVIWNINIIILKKLNKQWNSKHTFIAYVQWHAYEVNGYQEDLGWRKCSKLHVFLLHGWGMQQATTCIRLPTVHYTEPVAAHAPPVHLNELCTFRLFSRETERRQNRGIITWGFRTADTWKQSTVRRNTLDRWRICVMDSYFYGLQEGKLLLKVLFADFAPVVLSWWLTGSVSCFLLLLSAFSVDLSSLSLLPKGQEKVA